MTDHSPSAAFDHAFHKVAERHERIWLFTSLVLLSLLMAGAMYFVVADYGVVVKTAGYEAHPEDAATGAFAADKGLVQTGPNAYSVHMLAHLWQWTPSPLHVPQGAEITFYITSSDVLHGFEVQGTTLNVTAIPGTIGKVTYTFRHAGSYNIICNEFCGIEHQNMLGRIIVDPANHS